jgi:hypothetical protein
MIFLNQIKNKNQVISIGFSRKKSESWGKKSMKKNKKKTLNSDENLKTNFKFAANLRTPRFYYNKKSLVFSF